MIKRILNKIKTKKINISVIGLGYVGLPLCMRLIDKNFNVNGIDTDFDKINALKKGVSYIDNLKINNLGYFKNNPKNLSTKYDLVKKSDVIIICLPTPLKNNLEPEMKYIFDCFRKLKKILKKGQTIILESTVYPGATNEHFDKINKNLNFKIGKDIFLIYSPERENPGDKNFDYSKTPKVVSGKSKNCEKIAKNLYSFICKKVFTATSIEVAEMSKLLENTYRSVNIGLVNEFKIISDKMNLNIWDVIKAAKTKNFGFTAFEPGPGIGGHCIPIDPHYLSLVSKKYNYNPSFIISSLLLNRKMPSWTFKQILKIANKKNINLNKILFLGVAYKKNVDDLRESPSIKIMNLFHKKKYKIKFNDPHINTVFLGNKNKKILCSQKMNYKNLSNYDAIIISTNHDSYDYKNILKYSKNIIDTRGVFKNFKFQDKIDFV